MIRVFSHTQKDTYHWATTSIVVADGCSRFFWGAYITPFWWDLLFQNSAVVPKVAHCVVPMRLVYIIYYIHHIRIGPLHMATSGQITVTVFSHQFETQGTRTQAKSWLTVTHRTQSIANIPTKTVNNYHISLSTTAKYTSRQIPCNAFSTKLKNNWSDHKYL